MVVYSVIAAVYLAVIAITSVHAARRESIQRRAMSMAVEVGLALTPEVTGLVLSGLRRTSIARACGSSIGALVAIVGCFPVAASPDGWRAAALGWLIVGGSIVGGAIGGALPLLRADPARIDGPRLARSRAVGVSDYVDPVLRWIAALSVGLAIAATVWVAVLEPRDAIGPGLLTVLSALMLGLFVAAAKRIVAGAQPADSTTGLAWDDAQRASALRALADAPVALGLYAPLLAMTELEDSGVVAFSRSGPLVLVAAAILVASAAFWFASRRTKRRFLWRLWPETAAAGEAMTRGPHPTGVAR